MKLLRSVWAWVMGLFGKPEPEPYVTPVWKLQVDHRNTLRLRSANICLARRNRVAPRRERNNAYTTLCLIEGYYR